MVCQFTITNLCQMVKWESRVLGFSFGWHINPSSTNIHYFKVSPHAACLTNQVFKQLSHVNWLISTCCGEFHIMGLSYHIIFQLRVSAGPWEGHLDTNISKMSHTCSWIPEVPGCHHIVLISDRVPPDKPERWAFLVAWIVSKRSHTLLQ